jgi:small basic protein
VKLFGREPTLVLQAISALLGIFVALGIPGLSAYQAAAIIAALTAVIAAINAALVRPVAPAAFTGLVTAVATLVAAYGLDLTQQLVGAVQLTVVTVLALLIRGQVSPVGSVIQPGADGAFDLTAPAGPGLFESAPGGE